MQYRGLMLDISGLKNYPGGIAARARFLRQDPEQHAKPDSGGRYRRATSATPTGAGTMLGYRTESNCWVVRHGRIWSRASTRNRHCSRPCRPLCNGQQVDNLELPVMRGDGRQGQFSVNLSPMRDEQGNVDQHRGCDDRHHRFRHAAGQTDARGKDGCRRTAGLRRGARGQQSADGDPRFRRSADGES